MDQRITSSESDIDVYREESWPENLTLWHPHRLPEVQTTGAPIWHPELSEVVGEPGEAVIWETKAVESADKNVVIDRVEGLGQVDEYGCTVLSFIDGGYDIV